MLAVPVKVNNNGRIEVPLQINWFNAWHFLNAVYPIASDGQGIEWDIWMQIDASNIDLNNEFGRRLLWEKLKFLQPLLCGKLNRPPCYDQIIGFIPDMEIRDKNNRPLAGFTFGAPASIVMTTEHTGKTVAHEVGHNFGLGDEYDGCGAKYQFDVNPPPKNYKGGKADNNTVSAPISVH